MVAKLTVFVDVDGQPALSARSLAGSLLALQPDRIVLVGAANNVAYWRNGIEANQLFACQVDARPSRNLRAAGTIELTKALVESFYLAPPAENESWIIISARDGFSGLAESLQSGCAGKVHWLQSATTAGLRQAAGESQSVINTIMTIARRVQEATPGKPILIAALANKISEAMPEIHDKNFRAEHFGTRRFKDIFVSLGMFITGDSVYVDKPVKKSR